MDITYLDLVIAKVIYDFVAEDAHHNPPTQRQLLPPDDPSHGLVNNYLRDHQIPKSFTSELTSNQQLMKAIKRLRYAKLLVAEGTYVPTAELSEAFNRIGWKPFSWPIHAPITAHGEILWEMAQFRRNVRGYRNRREADEQSG